ncbi:LamB/YcsF family protein [Algoriphagus sp.]|uniref:LamB/YcsF family protein n=1 Tax=Algoriphagus sp. TaxID=1872435 RepID=UPI003299A682
MLKLPEINCDLGEGIPNEELIYPLIDTASIACGGHFGNKNTISQSIGLARAYQKKVGAHPSYPDQKNFGRKTMEISREDLQKSILNQIQTFELQAEKAKLPMDHIKFHGALYNDAASNSEFADHLTDFIASNFWQTALFIPPHSQLAYFAEQKGLILRNEVFGDRCYQDNYQLMPRSESGALMVSVSEISAQLETLLHYGYVSSASGEKLQMKADTICFHGDNPEIATILSSIRKRFWT